MCAFEPDIEMQRQQDIINYRHKSSWHTDSHCTVSPYE